MQFAFFNHFLRCTYEIRPWTPSALPPPGTPELPVLKSLQPPAPAWVRLCMVWGSALSSSRDRSLLSIWYKKVRYALILHFPSFRRYSYIASFCGVQAVAALSFLSPNQYTGNLSLSVSCRDVYVTTKLDIDMNIASSNSTHLMLDVVHDVEIFEDELIRINDFLVDFGLLVNILFLF